MAAGLKTLELISTPGFHDRLGQTAAVLCQGLEARAKAAGVPLVTNQVGGMFGFFFTDAPAISRFAQVTECNIERFQKFYHAMLQEGVYLAPSAYEAGFVSSAHDDKAIGLTLDAAEKAFGTL
jgi:glutamate-1-semialdehyde 2,1-aminomutase